MGSEEGYQEEKASSYYYCLINNIPESFHTSDLRNYFAVFIEQDGFDCFHFRHRPQFICDPCEGRSTTTTGETTTDSKSKKSLCCVVRFSSDENRNRFIKAYNKKFWMDKEGNDMNQRCFISPVKMEARDREKFAKELLPPRLMPKGNVGTRNSHFLGLIKECRLPPSLIRKLGLEFPTGRRFKKYCKVPLDYGTDLIEGDNNCDEEEVVTAKGHSISQVYLEKSKPKINSSSSSDTSNTKGTEEKDSESDEDADDDRGEEWERHVTFEDDPTSQERIKERLFEEELELVWEKGGPGIVWYTDAQFWDEQRGGFDEKTADNLDVDMQGYFEEGEGDKDAKDLMDMRRSKRFQAGLDEVSMFKKPQVPSCSGSQQQPRWISCDTSGGNLEQYSKGFAMKVMKKYGWKEGAGLGKSIEGIAEALPSEGQHPRDKRGIGYYGDTVEFKKQKKSHLQEDYDDEHRVRIGTIYDKPSDLDTPEPVLRSNSISHIKRYVKK